MFKAPCIVCGRVSDEVVDGIDIIRLAVAGWSDDTCPAHPRAWVATPDQNAASEYIAGARDRRREYLQAALGREGHA